ncbi:MAG: Rne/Rng family ribonuclease [bacterium]|nr:Rne/Rng family ribonuclease [bacterium]
MLQEVYISIDEREARAVLYEDGLLMETFIDREDSQVGQIYKGRVQNIIAGMNAAFVDIGQERNGFLCGDDASAHMRDLDVPPESVNRRSITDILRKGQDTIVQIAKEVIGKKGARLTTNISLSGRFFVLLPTIPSCHVGVSRKITAADERERLHSLASLIAGDRCGAIVRTAAENCSEEELRRDWELLWSRWDNIRRAAKVMPSPSLLYSGVSFVEKVVRDMLPPSCDKIVIDNRSELLRLQEILVSTSPNLQDKVSLYTGTKPLFMQLAIDEAIEKALFRKVYLKSGGNLVIERTEALWVIDVNTAQNIDRDAIVATNMEAAREVCRQMRLRDMGGIIIVDFINMESNPDQEKLLDCLAEELKRDRVRTKLVGLTELGLVQITRKREGKDLGRIMSEPCPHCHGNGRVLAARSVALKVRRELLRCHSDFRSEAYLVRLAPRTAWKFVGAKGELAEEVCRKLGCPIRVEADDSFLPTHYEIKRISLADLGPALDEGMQQKALMHPHYGDNADSCLATVEGHLVEVSNGAAFLGQEMTVRIVQAGEFISTGKALKV